MKSSITISLIKNDELWNDGETNWEGTWWWLKVRHRRKDSNHIRPFRRKDWWPMTWPAPFRRRMRPQPPPQQPTDSDGRKCRAWGPGIYAGIRAASAGRIPPRTWTRMLDRWSSSDLCPGDPVLWATWWNTRSDSDCGVLNSSSPLS